MTSELPVSRIRIPGSYPRGSFFGYGEPKWYMFGVGLGLRNLLHNGFKLGLRKTLGKIFQPINTYSRFPEYHLFEQATAVFLDGHNGDIPRVLDLGSPKLFGLYLASHYPVEVHLTDFSRHNLEEYVHLWGLIKDHSPGKVIFDAQDGRELTYPDEWFEIVYAMSVVEHIEGDGMDSQTCVQLLRVLKPGGLCLLSVPLGSRFMEQSAVGFTYFLETAEPGVSYFHQRIYDPQAAMDRLIAPLASQDNEVTVATIFRKRGLLTRAYHRARAFLGHDWNAVLGFTNPLWSRLLNAHAANLMSDFLTDYSKVHSLGDIYSDLIIFCRKSYGRVPLRRKPHTDSPKTASGS